MAISRPSLAILAICTIAFCSAITTTPAQAADTVLAASKTRKLKVIVEGGQNWCKPSLTMRMVLDADSPVLGDPDQQMAVMHLLRLPIANDCKIAEDAQIDVIEHHQSSGLYRGSASGDWVFTPVPSGPDVVPAPPLPATTTDTATTTAQVQAEEQPADTLSTADQEATTPSPSDERQGTASTDSPPTPYAINYASALAAIVKQDRSLENDDKVVTYWAAAFFQEDFRKNRRQEFRLRPVIEQGRADLDKYLKSPDADHVFLLVSAHLDDYDFQKKAFPFRPLGTRTHYYKFSSLNGAPVPFAITIEQDNADLISSLPMDTEKAKEFIDRRTKKHSVNRKVYILLDLKVSSHFEIKRKNNYTIKTTLENATFYNKDGKDPIYYISQKNVKTLISARIAAEEEKQIAERKRKEEEARKRFEARRARYIQQLSSAPREVLLANWISNKEITPYTHLDNLRSARETSLVSQHPIAVSMLVQAGGDGQKNVETAWPGHLVITAQPEQPTELAKSNWYLIRGQLQTPDPENGKSLSSQLFADEIYPCSQPQCGEVSTATALMNHRFSTLSADQ